MARRTRKDSVTPLRFPWLPSRVLLDTGPIYGLLDDRDQWFARAGKLFEKLEDEGAEVIAAYPAMLEAHRILLTRGRVSVQHIHALLEDAFEIFGVMYPLEADTDAARALLKRFNDQRISLTDATIAAMSVREGMRVATFDARHFGLMGATVYELEEGS